MGICCDLEVDVNGEEVFFADKIILTSFSNRLRKLFGKLVGTTNHLKVIFLDFPGGAKGFELVIRFCYNNGKTVMTPYNVILLHCAADFMEMKTDQMDNFFEGIQRRTWSELVLCLKQCQDLYEVTKSSSILQSFLDLLVEKLALVNVATSDISSSEISSWYLSSDSSSNSVKTYLSQATWWFEDLVFLNINLVKKIVQSMISQKFEHSTLCSFLIYYQRSKFLGVSLVNKGEIIETLINLLFLLERSSISSGGLFNIFRLSLCFKISKCCKNRLEAMVGSKLDQATIDDLLVPSPRGKKYVYDVDLILRLMKSFLTGNQFSTRRLSKVARLMDLYLAEVSADPNLKPSKFVALAMSLPDFARVSHDRIYIAIDMYLKVHSNLCQEEKMKIFSVLNYNMLSIEVLIDLAKNYEFQQGTVHGAHTFQQFKFKSLVQDSTKHVKPLSDSLFCYIRRGNKVRMWVLNKSFFMPNNLNLIFKSKTKDLDHMKYMVLE